MRSVQPDTSVICSSSTTHTNVVEPLSTGTHSVVSSDEGSEAEFIANMLDLGANDAKKFHGDMSEDFSSIFDDLLVGPPSSEFSSNRTWNNCGTFLEEIANYLDTRDLPCKFYYLPWCALFATDSLTFFFSMAQLSTWTCGFRRALQKVRGHRMS
jgi:hypothetical protein